MANKVIRNGRVAVLYSSDYGGSWSTALANRKVAQTMIFHPRLVEAVENETNSPARMRDILLELTGEVMYTGAARCLDIKWVDQGTRFFISESGDSEEVVIISPDFGFVA